MPAQAADPAERLHLTLGPGVAGLAAAQSDLIGFLQAAGCDARTLFRAELVVEEVVMNIMTHGHPDDAREADPERAAQIALDACAGSGCVRIAIEDDRAAFNPLQVISAKLPERLEDAAIGGVGLRLMRKYADRLSYARTTGGRNRLEMEFLGDFRRPG